jgi:tRNA threonylcarbamoyladenosine biosynthesis protein TsaB
MPHSSDPRILLLETSGRTGQVAVAQADRLLSCRQLEETRRHARDLAPAVRDLLGEQGWSPQEVDLIIVSRGPGSYTGLRVGIMSAKAFAYATGCTLIAVDTFAVIAAQAPANVDSLDVFTDAQQDRVYYQRFVRTQPAGPMTPRTGLAILPFARWLDDGDKPAWVTGPGLHGKEQRLPATTRPLAAELWEPQPQVLLNLGLDRYLQGHRDDLWTVEPLYLRPSAAEEQWQTKR